MEEMTQPANPIRRKPLLPVLNFAVLTATTNLHRASSCLQTWIDNAAYEWPLWVVVPEAEALPSGLFDSQAIFVAAPQPMGSVPAFAAGMKLMLDHPHGYQIIACLHDDLAITEHGWDATVLEFFSAHPECGLAGFGGAKGLGDPGIYQKPYNPMQLARRRFRSNMCDAEAHGERTWRQQRVACLDGFSQIGRRTFWLPDGDKKNLFEQMAEWGVIHHCYDAALGCFAARFGVETWLIPLGVHHLGGQTAVADRRYAEWARTQNQDGDAGFWKDAHRIVYDEFGDVLPIDV